MIYKTLYWKLIIEQQKPYSKQGWPHVHRKGSSSCSTRGTRHVIAVKNPVVNHECEKGRYIWWQIYK
jgi:hypothetical protein